MKTRDLEFLSAYLDGQLSSSESADLEARINSDAELFSTLADLRAARGILRQLPKRKSPRNFTLTRKMVGLNPPLPRSYSIFRFATAFASLLLVLTFAANIAAPRLNYVGPNTGWGGGGGGGFGGIGGGPVIQQSAPEMAAAATEAPAMVEAPVATEAPAMDMMPLPTALAAAPQEKSAGAENSAPQDDTTPVESPALIPIGWQVFFLAAALIGAAVTYALRQSAKIKWR